MPNALQQNRIASIDIVRGIAMVIMALDHVRDFVHINANVNDPLDLATTSPALYFTRWITHLCAPIFVFLSGTSIYLQMLRKSRKELGLFVIKRGLWLIVCEWTLIAFAWTFNPFFNLIPFQVIWAIGISMVILGLLLLAGVQQRVLLLTGAIIVFGHNLLDFPEAAQGFKAGFWWDLMHHGHFSFYQFAPGHYAAIIYPFVPWTGLMLLGYCFGYFFKPGFDSSLRKKILVRSGIGAILLFGLLRWSNWYGDPADWVKQADLEHSLFAFMNVQKYPPSLLYLCATIGPAMLLLAWTESLRNWFTNVILVFGRTAFFYYILHLYLIHSIATVLFFARGHTMEEAIQMANQAPFLFVVTGEGYGLAGVYVFWILVVVLLYPICKWYDRYKTEHKEKWWLSYL